MVQLSTDLDALYPEHLAGVKTLYGEAIRDAGKEGVLFASGALKTAFLDDHSYPFKVNPHFKAWLPVIVSAAASFVAFSCDSTSR